MKVHQIDFEETKRFSPIFLDYINNKKELQNFYAYRPEVESFKNAIESRNFDHSKREVLFTILEKQYREISIKPAVSENIRALKKDNTFTVTTGHQLNIFTGPLFFIYKIVTVINMAKMLKETYPAYNFVPVYWMASEDHDFDEINNFKLFGQKYTWQSRQNGAVGDMDTSSIKTLLEQIPEIPDFFSAGYTEQKNLAEATRYIVDHLFGDQGLVILDANDKELKKEFQSIIKDDIFHNNAHILAQKASGQLENLEYKSQVFPRPINFFFMEYGVRERIEEEGEKFIVMNSSLSLSKSEIESLIDEHPEKFSPNVVMRPVYQEVILPNLAYVGGPAEVAYWLQLKGIFDHYQVPFPILFPRLFVLILAKTISKKMEKLNLSNLDLFNDFNEIKEKLLFSDREAVHDLDDQLAEIQRAFESIKSKANDIDQSLEGFVMSEFKKVEKGVENIQKRLKKAEEQKEDVKINQLKSILDKLFPDGNPQEREDNFLNFYINNPSFINELIALLDPFVLKYNILSEDV